jgi:CBS domain-containing protein
VTGTGETAEAGVACIDAGKTLRQAGHLMRDLGVGTLGVRGDNGEVQGTISHDMVVRRIAAGGDPKTVTVGEVAVSVAASASPVGGPRVTVGPGRDTDGYELAWDEGWPGLTWHGRGGGDGTGTVSPTAAA